MSELAASTAGDLAGQSPESLSHALRGSGLWLDVGAATIRVRADSNLFAQQLRAAYGCFPMVTQADWADVHVHLRPGDGLRRWLKPQVVLDCDALPQFDPFPAHAPLPLFEWGCNALIGRRLNDLLLLHAGAVERNGLAMLLPAMPGSGKSTLTAALSQRGWRLLSDEFGAYDPVAGAFRAVLKPIALKNQSIEVIRRFAPQARWGPEFPKTRKGTVAHLAASAESVARRHELAKPGAVVLPRWEAGSTTRWEPLEPHVLFSALAFNAFNYSTLGAMGYEAAVRLVRQCLGWQLVYSDLDDALAQIDRVWPQVLAHHGVGA